ncbi:MAG: ABC transporter ATP-binding protein [Leptolyngbyaceae bacterium]|nr:ABC transporter ATP-binding protein [Leptolyngbyaceae bacterium]
MTPSSSLPSAQPEPKQLSQSYVPIFRDRLLLSMAWRYPIRTTLTILMGFSGALFNGISTILIVPVVLTILDQAIDPRGVPPLLKLLLSPFDSIPEPYRLAAMTGAILLALGLKNLTTYLNVLMAGSLKQAVGADLREQALQLLLNVDMDFYSKTGVGDILNRVNGEMGRTAGAVQSLLKIMGHVITITVFVYILLGMSVKLTLASAILFFVVVLINQAFIQRSKGFGKQLSIVSRDYSSRLTETLTGIRLIKETVGEQREYDTLLHLIKRREKLDFQSQANAAAINPISEMVGITALITIVFVGRLLFEGELEALSTILLTYLVVLFKLLPVVSQLNTARSQFANCSASVDVVHHFLRRDDKPFMPNGTQPFKGLQTSIRFEGVSFTYPGADSPSLKNIDLTLPKGTTLALVGESGAGKSTLADLVPRFYDPTQGRITFDGTDLRDFDRYSLRSAMGIVSQEAFLFNDTVRNNIAYARPGATDGEIIDAMQRANAYEFILKLPQGLETQIGDRGVLLSGGQRQRLAIARALLKNADILILDEATSALDTASEKLVQTAIDELSRDRTSIVIAHRLSTIRNADQIAVMKQGQVVELGNHDQLLALGGYYHQLYTMQFSKQLVDDPPAAEPRAHGRHGTLSQVSHSIRDRLNSMIGSLSVVTDGLVDSPEEQQEMLIEAYESAAEMLHFVEQLEKSQN